MGLSPGGATRVARSSGRAPVAAFTMRGPSPRACRAAPASAVSPPSSAPPSSWPARSASKCARRRVATRELVRPPAFLHVADGTSDALWGRAAHERAKLFSKMLLHAAARFAQDCVGVMRREAPPSEYWRSRVGIVETMEGPKRATARPSIFVCGAKAAAVGGLRGTDVAPRLTAGASDSRRISSGRCESRNRRSASTTACSESATYPSRTYCSRRSANASGKTMLSVFMPEWAPSGAFMAGIDPPRTVPQGHAVARRSSRDSAATSPGLHAAHFPGAAGDGHRQDRAPMGGSARAEDFADGASRACAVSPVHLFLRSSFFSLFSLRFSSGVRWAVF